MKKRFIWYFLALCIVIGFIVFVNKYNKPKLTTITALPIKEVTEKSNTDEFYVTVLLDEAIVEEYNLANNEFKFRTNESIYDKVVVNSGFAGASLKITHPDDGLKKDIGMILKENETEYCEIIGITTNENILLD